MSAIETGVEAESLYRLWRSWDLGHEALPILRELLSENMDSQKYREDISFLVGVIDGGIASYGEREVLDLMREVVARSPVPERAIEYLVKKGDESDIERLENVREICGVWTPSHEYNPYTVELLRERLEATSITGALSLSPRSPTRGPRRYTSAKSCGRRRRRKWHARMRLSREGRLLRKSGT